MKGGMKALDWAFRRGASMERKKRSWSCAKVRVAVESRSGARLRSTWEVETDILSEDNRKSGEILSLGEQFSRAIWR